MENTLLIWDIENISYKYYNKVLNKLNYKPEKIFVVSKRILGKNENKFIETNNLKYINSKNKLADEYIFNIMKITKENTKELSIVSSDSDFVQYINKHITEYNKINLIIEENNSKRILMLSDITNKKINYILLSNENKDSKFKQKLVKNKNKNKNKSIKNKKQIDNFITQEKNKQNQNQISQVNYITEKYLEKIEIINKKSREREEKKKEKNEKSENI